MRFGGSYPHVFTASTEIGRDLDDLGQRLDTDLAPFEVLMRPRNDDARRLPNLAGAVVATSRELGSMPGTTAVFPLDLLPAEAWSVEPSLDPAAREQRLREQLARPELEPWLDVEGGLARLEVHFERTGTFAAKAAVLERLEKLQSGFLERYELVPHGPGTTALRVEQQGLDDLRRGGAVSMAALLLVLIAGTTWRGGLRAAGLAVVVSLLPLALTTGAMVLFGVSWSVALIPLPSLLLGLAVDDSIHLTWRMRSRVRLRPLAAILGTTVLVVACVGTLATSSLRANRDVGVLLAGGLSLALLADLTLLPALATRSRRRAPR